MKNNDLFIEMQEQLDKASEQEIFENNLIQEGKI